MKVIDGPRITEAVRSTDPEHLGNMVGLAIAQAENGEWAASPYTYSPLAPLRLRAEHHKNAKKGVVYFVESQ